MICSAANRIILNKSQVIERLFFDGVIFSVQLFIEFDLFWCCLTYMSSDRKTPSVQGFFLFKWPLYIYFWKRRQDTKNQIISLDFDKLNITRKQSFRNKGRKLIAPLVQTNLWAINVGWFLPEFGFQSNFIPRHLQISIRQIFNYKNQVWQ